MSKFLLNCKKALTAYVPGEQPQDKQYVKLNTNESPFKPSKRAIRGAIKATKNLQLYPDPEVKGLIKSLARVCGVKEENLLTANGSDEVLNFIFMAFCDNGRPAVFPDISYGFYSVFAKNNNVSFKEIPLNENFEINVDDYVGINANIFIANPNAPTGLALSLADIEKIAKGNPDNIVVIDEAYVDFGGESAIPLTKKYKNLIVVQTFSKSRSMAGARLGFCVADKDVIDDLKLMKYSVNPYNVNSMTYAAAVGVLSDNEYTVKNCQKIINAREFTVNELKKLGFNVLNSKANFVFCSSEKISGQDLYLKLKEKGVLVRYFNKPRIDNFIRVTIGSIKQMKVFIEKVKSILEETK